MPCLYPPSGRLAVWPSGRLRRIRKLTEEAKIVAGKCAHVVDTGAHHRQTLDAQSESKAAVDVRVVPNRAQDIGMDHAGAAHLQPAGSLADPAASPTTDGAIDREINARLDEGEEVAAEPNAPLQPKELAGHLGQGPFEIGHRDVPIDRQAFQLMEHPFMRRVLRLVAVDAAGHNHA